MSDIRDYQVDHLLLLVGSNPLPNAVAGKLLTTAGGKITLIHSHDSCDLAQRLKSCFQNAAYSGIELVEVKEADTTSVYNSVSNVLKSYRKLEDSVDISSKASVGLNYTSGTKVMSVQAYRALEEWARSHHRGAIFSYLDAHTFQMCFDPVPGRDAISFYVGQEVNISIRELLDLHNWEIKGQPLIEPVLPLSAKALLAVHSDTAEANIWTRWLHNELFKEARKQVALDLPFRVFRSREELLQPLCVMHPGGDWKNTVPQDLTIPWPDLPNLCKIMCAELKQDDVENIIFKNVSGFKNAKDFCKWLNGIWLEHAVLDVLRNCPELQSEHCCMNIKPNVPGSSESDGLFEFDVVAMRGYQLFAFSCSTVSSKGLLKQKLFEAYVRAQQMGGDEACVALVCCAQEDVVDNLEKDMRSTFGSRSRIRVFGSKDLVNLATHIENWVREQSKEH